MKTHQQFFHRSLSIFLALLCICSFAIPGFAGSLTPEDTPYLLSDDQRGANVENLDSCRRYFSISPEEEKEFEQYANTLLKQLKQRKTTLHIPIDDSASFLKNRSGNDIFQIILNLALKKGGEGIPGEYYADTFCDIKNSNVIIDSSDFDTHTYTFYYSVQYFTTPEQEQWTNNKVKEIVSGMKLSGKSTTQKLRVICDWADKNFAYDHKYKSKKYTATTNPNSLYYALKHKTALCRAYAQFIRLSAQAAGIKGVGVQAGVTRYDIGHEWAYYHKDGRDYILDPTSHVTQTGKYMFMADPTHFHNPQGDLIYVPFISDDYLDYALIDDLQIQNTKEEIENAA